MCSRTVVLLIAPCLAIIRQKFIRGPKPSISGCVTEFAILWDVSGRRLAAHKMLKPVLQINENCPVRRNEHMLERFMDNVPTPLQTFTTCMLSYFFLSGAGCTANHRSKDRLLLKQRWHLA